MGSVQRYVHFERGKFKILNTCSSSVVYYNSIATRNRCVQLSPLALSHMSLRCLLCLLLIQTLLQDWRSKGNRYQGNILWRWWWWWYHQASESQSSQFSCKGTGIEELFYVEESFTNNLIIDLNVPDNNSTCLFQYLKSLLDHGPRAKWMKLAAVVYPTPTNQQTNKQTIYKMNEADRDWFKRTVIVDFYTKQLCASQIDACDIFINALKSRTVVKP